MYPPGFCITSPFRDKLSIIITDKSEVSRCQNPDLKVHKKVPGRNTQGQSPAGPYQTTAQRKHIADSSKPSSLYSGLCSVRGVADATLRRSLQEVYSESI